MDKDLDFTPGSLAESLLAARSRKHHGRNGIQSENGNGLRNNLPVGKGGTYIKQLNCITLAAFLFGFMLGLMSKLPRNPMAVNQKPEGVIG